MKALVGEGVGAFSVIVKTGCETDGLFHSTNTDAVLLRISVVRRQILDPDWTQCLVTSSHHRISPPNYDVVWLPVLVS